MRCLLLGYVFCVGFLLSPHLQAMEDADFVLNENDTIVIDLNTLNAGSLNYNNDNASEFFLRVSVQESRGDQCVVGRVIDEVFFSPISANTTDELASVLEYPAQDFLKALKNTSAPKNSLPQCGIALQLRKSQRFSGFISNQGDGWRGTSIRFPSASEVVSDKDPAADKPRVLSLTPQTFDLPMRDANLNLAIYVKEN